MSRTSAIYLVGMMGVGKSTVGQRLALRLGRVFIDTDREVERVAGRTIAEIFANEGEAYFRALEADAIEDASNDGTVIALGGGAVVNPGAIDRLLDAGVVVYLMAPPAELVDRIGGGVSRPLLGGLDRPARIRKITDLLAERLPFYLRASIHVDATASVEQVVNGIIDELATG